MSRAKQLIEAYMQNTLLASVPNLPGYQKRANDYDVIYLKVLNNGFSFSAYFVLDDLEKHGRAEVTFDVVQNKVELASFKETIRDIRDIKSVVAKFERKGMQVLNSN